MYANHDVKYSYWNYHKWGADADSLLFNPRIGMEEWKQVVERVISRYFHLPNYAKIDGKPIFAIFNTDIFKEFDVMLNSGNTEVFIDTPEEFRGNPAGFGYEDEEAVYFAEKED